MYGATAVVLAIAIIGVATLYPGLTSSSTNNGTQGMNSTTQLGPSQDQGQTQTQQVLSTSTAASQQVAQAGAPSQALLLVQLTDPPVVPAGTTSLNLTYSAIHLIVAEPSQNNTVTMNDVTVTPQNGSASIDLLQLQNASQTIATANIPTNSTIYSVSFTVTSISIGINGTSFPVTLATGSNTFQVTLARPALVGGTSAALLQLNPVVVNTPTGYQMIPSAAAIVKGDSKISGHEEIVGSRQQLTQQDDSELNGAKGQVSSRLVALSSNGTTTTVTIQVNNTGSAPIQLVAIGLHGEFTVQGAATGCTTASTSSTTSSSTTASTSSTTSNSTTSSSSTSTSSSSSRGEQEGDHNINSTSTSRSVDEGNGGNYAGDHQNCWNGHGHGDELVFVPVTQGSNTTKSASSSSSSSSTSSNSTSTTSSSSSSSTAALGCTAVSMATPHENNNAREGDHGGLTLAPGECVTLTFTGAITFGGSDQSQPTITVVPNTTSGQTFTLHVIASDSAETTLNCALPLTTTSCTPANPHND